MMKTKRVIPLAVVGLTLVGLTCCNLNTIKHYAKRLLKGPAIIVQNNDTPIDKVWGIDISHHQKNVKWSKMADKKPDFIFLKATEGSTHTDTRYKQYKAEAEKLDIPTGAYHFFSYSSDGAKQARHFIATAKLKPGDLLPVLDCEFTNKMASRENVTRELMKFIRTIEAELGVSPIIYCECHYYNKFLKNEVKGRCPLWISNFHREPRCNYVFWQKTDKFQHPSFAGTVDYNSFKGETQGLKKYQLK